LYFVGVCLSPKPLQSIINVRRARADIMPPSITVPRLRHLARHGTIVQLSRKITTPVSSQSSPSRLYTSKASQAEQTADSTRHIVDKKLAQQSRHNIDRQSDETSKSGTDDAVAAQSTLSFDPDRSGDPEQVRRETARSNSNPLEASPANREMSTGTVEVEGGTGTKTAEVTVKEGSYRRESGTKKAEAGFEKKAFAGSSKVAKDKERPPMIRPGSR